MTTEIRVPCVVHKEDVWQVAINSGLDETKARALMDILSGTWELAFQLNEDGEVIAKAVL